MDQKQHEEFYRKFNTSFAVTSDALVKETRALDDIAMNTIESVMDAGDKCVDGLCTIIDFVGETEELVSGIVNDTIDFLGDPDIQEVIKTGVKIFTVIKSVF